MTEVILWSNVLNKKQLRGYSFLRQRPVGNYIVYFNERPIGIDLPTFVVLKRD